MAGGKRLVVRQVVQVQEDIHTRNVCHYTYFKRVPGICPAGWLEYWVHVHIYVLGDRKEELCVFGGYCTDEVRYLCFRGIKKNISYMLWGIEY